MEISSLENVETLVLRPHPEGVTLILRVKPKASADTLVAVHAGALKLAVRAAPEKGQANLSVRKLVAQALGVTQDSVEVLKGATSQNKTVLVRGASPEAIRLALARALGSAEEKPRRPSRS